MRQFKSNINNLGRTLDMSNNVHPTQTRINDTVIQCRGDPCGSPPCRQTYRQGYHNNARQVRRKTEARAT